MRYRRLHEIDRIEAGARRRRPIEQTNNIFFVRRIGWNGLSASAIRVDGSHHLLDLVRAAARNEHVMSSGGEAPA